MLPLILALTSSIPVLWLYCAVRRRWPDEWHKQWGAALDALEEDAQAREHLRERFPRYCLSTLLTMLHMVAGWYITLMFLALGTVTVPLAALIWLVALAIKATNRALYLATPLVLAVYFLIRPHVAPHLRRVWGRVWGWVRWSGEPNSLRCHACHCYVGALARCSYGDYEDDPRACRALVCRACGTGIYSDPFSDEPDEWRCPDHVPGRCMPYDAYFNGDLMLAWIQRQSRGARDCDILEGRV